MSKLIAINEEYATWVKDIKLRFRSSQLQASLKVNQEVLRFYWQLGQDMVQMNIEQRWGESVIKMLSQDLKEALPEVNGFSPSNLYYIKRFYITYNQEVVVLPQAGVNSLKQNTSAFLPQLGVKIECNTDALFLIPWTHHKYILDKVKGDAKKGLFFVQKTLENNWSRAMLQNFLDTDLYERQSKAITNFENTLPVQQGELAGDLLHDPYNFDFLTMTEGYKEKELKQALIDNIIRFLMELGSGFAFMGQEYARPQWLQSKELDQRSRVHNNLQTKI